MLLSKDQVGQNSALKTAVLQLPGEEVRLPTSRLRHRGRAGLDITRLRDQTGYITLDPGFGNTGACESAITFIDGEKGILRYRGIPIEQLAEKSHLHRDGLAADLRASSRTTAELGRFRELLTEQALLHEAFKHHFEGFPVDAPPMAMLSAMINTLSCFHPELSRPSSTTEALRGGRRPPDQQGPHDRRLSSRKIDLGLPFIYPDPKLRYVPQLPAHDVLEALPPLRAATRRSSRPSNQS